MGQYLKEGIEELNLKITLVESLFEPLIHIFGPVG
jgi:hypothetical protein